MPGVCIFQQFMPPDPSGAGKQALTLARTVREAGWSVTLLTEDHHGSGPSGHIEDFPVSRIAPLRPDPSPNDIVAYWLRVARALAALRSTYDVLHVHSVHFYQLGAVPAARLLRKKVVVRSSIAGDFTGLDGSRSGRLRRRLLGMAHEFVVLSDSIAEEYRSSGLPSSRLNLIPNGVNTALYHPVSSDEKVALRRQLGLPTDERILVYHGVFIKRKRILRSIDVLEPLLAELGVTLLLVGGPARDEPLTGYAAAVRARVMRSDAGGRIIVRDFAPDVHRYLQASDAYLLASTGEGMSNAMLEAMAVGLVPFVTRTSGSEDVIDDGRSGFLFPPDDAAAFERRLREAFGRDADPDRLATMSRAAAACIQDRFSIEVTGRQYVDLYERLLA